MQNTQEENIIPQEVLVVRYLRENFKQNRNNNTTQELGQLILESRPLSELSTHLLDNAILCAQSKYLNPRIWEGYEEAQWDKENMRGTYNEVVNHNDAFIREFNQMVNAISACCCYYNQNNNPAPWTTDAIDDIHNFKNEVSSNYVLK